MGSCKGLVRSGRGWWRVGVMGGRDLLRTYGQQNIGVLVCSMYVADTIGNRGGSIRFVMRREQFEICLG